VSGLNEEADHENLKGRKPEKTGMKEQASENDFVPVCKVSDLPDPGKAVFEVGDRLVALFHVSGTFWALDDLCTHDGGPLAEGRLEDHTVVCPRHGAKFDIRTGQALTMPATRATATHQVQVKEGTVYVRLNDE
jgi:3-phenylpropionate/trans-cinnamate dioxygenase ferredoxin subunit